MWSGSPNLRTALRWTGPKTAQHTPGRGQTRRTDAESNPRLPGCQQKNRIAYGGSYHSVRRLIQKLTAAHGPPVRRMECAPAEEAQVDFGKGAAIIGADGRAASPPPALHGTASSFQIAGQ